MNNSRSIIIKMIKVINKRPKKINNYLSKTLKTYINQFPLNYFKMMSLHEKNNLKKLKKISKQIQIQMMNLFKKLKTKIFLNQFKIIKIMMLKNKKKTLNKKKSNKK